jgi:hypothetical protein
MPPLATPAKKGVGGGLSKKSIGGLPLWAVIIGGALVAYLGYRFIAGRSAASSAASPTSSNPAGLDTSGGAGSSAASPSDLTPLEDLAQALNGYTYTFGGGGNFNLGSTAGGDGSAVTTPTAPSSPAPSETATLPFIPGPPAPSEPAPAAQAPTYPSGTPEGAIIPNVPAAITSAASANPKATSDALAQATASVNAAAAKIPDAPHNAATNITPAKPVAGTTSNKDAVKRSGSLH